MGEKTNARLFLDKPCGSAGFYSRKHSIKFFQIAKFPHLKRRRQKSKPDLKERQIAMTQTGLQNLAAECFFKTRDAALFTG